jgi:hypothetical protein
MFMRSFGVILNHRNAGYIWLTANIMVSCSNFYEMKWRPAILFFSVVNNCSLTGLMYTRSAL